MWDAFRNSLTLLLGQKRVAPDHVLVVLRLDVGGDVLVSGLRARLGRERAARCCARRRRETDAHCRKGSAKRDMFVICVDRLQINRALNISSGFNNESFETSTSSRQKIATGKEKQSVHPCARPITMTGCMTIPPASSKPQCTIIKRCLVVIKPAYTIIFSEYIINMSTPSSYFFHHHYFF